MWKMYSLSDSRYITGDTFTVLMEGCTAVRPLPRSPPCPSTRGRACSRSPRQLLTTLLALHRP